MLLCALATVSTSLALILQDRALDQELDQQARIRLARSAEAADRLLADHLRGLVGRYAAISRTPELRANLDTRHAPTLGFYAGHLLEDQGAALVTFFDEASGHIASAGDPRLRVFAESAISDAPAPGGHCVGAHPVGMPDGRTSAGWGPCRYPEGSAEGSLFETGGALYALVTVPLRTGGRLDGGLVVVEEVQPATIARLSELSGGDIRFGPRAERSDLEAAVRTQPGLALRIVTTFDAELAIIRRARLNLIVSGLVALMLALVASLLLAHAFARPIIRMGEATRRLTAGDLDQRVVVEREDEIGQLGAAFNQLVSRLSLSQDRVRSTQRRARFGNWQLDVESRRFEGSDECRRLLGIEDDGPFDRDRFLDGVALADRDELDQAFGKAIEEGVAFRVDVRAASGTRERILHVRCLPRRDPSPRVVEGSIQDVTERRRADEQIRFLSHHDRLTGLGNRERALEALRARIDEGGTGEPFAVIVLGLGDLRGVTDTLGHTAGDAILVEAANRLRAIVGRGAQFDERAELVAKLGDERFAIIVDRAAERQETIGIARRLVAPLREPFPIPNDEVSLIPSLGIALWPKNGAMAEALLRNGETALARAQLEEPGAIRFFHRAMLQDASRRLRIANLLRRAIAADALELHYQPRVDAREGAVLGFEALARWSDRELGPISPAEFIPIAEATGTIHALGRWSIERATNQLRAWRDAGHRDLSMSINVSHHELRPELVPLILDCTGDLDPSRLELEVTESGLIEEGDVALETLTTLRGHGYRIALDDFGTGYSSLSYLQGIPIDTVKIDRGFIRDIADDEGAAALTGSVIAMCRALGLHTVAEGVETPSQLEALVRLECEEVQGYLFSMPLPMTEATEYLERLGESHPQGLPI